MGNSAFGFHGKMMSAHHNNMNYYGEKWGGRHGPRWCGELQPGNFHTPYNGQLSEECMVALSKQARARNEQIFRSVPMPNLANHVSGTVDLGEAEGEEAVVSIAAT